MVSAQLRFAAFFHRRVMPETDERVVLSRLQQVGLQRLGFRVWGLGFRVCTQFRVEGLEFRVFGSGFRVWG